MFSFTLWACLYYIDITYSTMENFERHMGITKCNKILGEYPIQISYCRYKIVICIERKQIAMTLWWNLTMFWMMYDRSSILTWAILKDFARWTIDMYCLISSWYLSQKGNQLHVPMYFLGIRFCDICPIRKNPRNLIHEKSR